MPSGSVEPEALTATLRSVTVAVKAAVGGWFGAVATTDRVVVAVAPSSSVTVSVTV